MMPSAIYSALAIPPGSNPQGYSPSEKRTIAEGMNRILPQFRELRRREFQYDNFAQRLGKQHPKVVELRGKLDELGTLLTRLNNATKFAWDEAVRRGLAHGTIPTESTAPAGLGKWLEAAVSIAIGAGVAIAGFFLLGASIFAAPLILLGAIVAVIGVLIVAAPEVGAAVGAAVGGAVREAGSGGIGLLLGIGVFVLALTFLKGSRRGQVA